jgi:hypothetical protein
MYKKVRLTKTFVPLLSDHPCIAIVFGAGRPLCGVLLNPSDLAREEGLNPNELIERAWPAIERANADAPSHSQLVREMVRVLPEGTEVPVATKMSILRPACYAKFKDIIGELSPSLALGRAMVDTGPICAI